MSLQRPGAVWGWVPYHEGDRFAYDQETDSYICPQGQRWGALHPYQGDTWDTDEALPGLGGRLPSPGVRPLGMCTSSEGRTSWTRINS